MAAQSQGYCSSGSALIDVYEDYVLASPRDAYLEGVDQFPDLVRVGVPYQEWFV